MILLLALPLCGHAQVVEFPNSTNSVKLRLYTDGAPASAHLLNMFDLEAGGETLIQAPAAAVARQGWLIDGRGPTLSQSNGLEIIERASGREWQYLRLDGTRAYADRLAEFKRGLLFVAPDLFVIHDHFISRKPVRLQACLHVPPGTIIDPVWKDLRYNSSNAWFRVCAPGKKNELRAFTRLEPLPGSLQDDTVMELAPPNKSVTELDVLTVLVVGKTGEKRDYAFKLLESINAVGARIHRDGLPTLVAFRLNPSSTNSTLTGFPFDGPVGVDVFRPVKRLSH